MLTIQKIQSSPCFSSSIPDEIQINTDYDSVDVDVFCGNKPIFSTTLYTYQSNASLANLRELIEEYMRDNNLIVSVISVNAQARQEQAETSTTVIYSSYRQVCDIKNFLETHYLTTRTSFLIPYNGAQCLSWYQEEPPGDDECYTEVLTEAGDFKSYRIMDRVDNGQAQSELFKPNDIFQTLLKQHPTLRDVTFKTIKRITVHRGKRSMTFYLAKETPQLMLNFRNCFNCLETAYIYAATTLKTDIDRSEATCNNQTTFYDQQTTHAHEVNITTLSIEHALWLNQLFESHKVTDRKGNAILISDITSEISDETNATNKLKFTWKFSDNSISLVNLSRNRIFTEHYTPQFE